MRTFKQRKIPSGESFTANDTVKNYFEMTMRGSRGLNARDFPEDYFFTRCHKLTRMCVFDTELLKILLAKGGI